MPRFHPLTIKSIRQETPDCVSLALDVPPELRETFRYQPGQYLTLRRQHEGEELRRSYSLCSSPAEDEWRVAVKQVPGGRFSTLALGLQVGDVLDVLPPQGRFVLPALGAATARRVALFGAGSGITPLLSIAKTVLQAEPRSHVYLLYGNRGRNSIIFKEQLEALKNKHLGRLSVYHVLSREQGDSDLLYGRLDQAKATEFLQKVLPAAQLDECFICGPEAMIADVRQALAEAGVAPEKVHFELFTSAAATGPRAAAPRPAHAPADDQRSQVTLQLDGRAYQLPMSYYGDTVLDAALAAGVDAPYSCKNGMCSTCRARVTAGTAVMDVNYSLDEHEVAAGYVLTCQARPTAPDVTVDFDQ